MVVLADELLVLRAVTEAVVPRLRFKEVAVVTMSFEVDVPILPVEAVKDRLHAEILDWSV